jgi:hypothetical protein
MFELEPIPDLIAAARRVATREWTVGPEEVAYGPDMDPNLQTLVDASYVVLYFPPTRLRLDYWTLTQRGRDWLAAHDTEGADHA